LGSGTIAGGGVPQAVNSGSKSTAHRLVVLGQGMGDLLSDDSGGSCPHCHLLGLAGRDGGKVGSMACLEIGQRLVLGDAGRDQGGGIGGEPVIVGLEAGTLGPQPGESGSDNGNHQRRRRDPPGERNQEAHHRRSSIKARQCLIRLT
jgi:hypothetical protein